MGKTLLNIFALCSQLKQLSSPDFTQCLQDLSTSNRFRRGDISDGKYYGLASVTKPNQYLSHSSNKELLISNDETKWICFREEVLKQVCFHHSYQIYFALYFYIYLIASTCNMGNKLCKHGWQLKPRLFGYLKLMLHVPLYQCKY